MNQEILAYHHILCPVGAPDFLTPYLDTPAMQRLRGIGLFCGTDYTNLYHHRYFFSRFDHSLGVALIVWHFTRDQKQTLAGLFHDISTPIFSHSVDFMNGDALTQTSTEAKTSETIRNSPEILALLKRDGFTVEEVEDYHIYPIADNDSPRLSADRLEYTLSTALVWLNMWNCADIDEIYGDLTINHESDVPELCFRTVQTAEKFTCGSSAVCKLYQMNENKIALSLLGDILKMGIQKGLFTPDQLYQMTETQAIILLANAPKPEIRNAWNVFTSLERIHRSSARPDGCYSVQVNSKRRYINPLCESENEVCRVVDVSSAAKIAIDDLLAFRDASYGYIDFSLCR